MPEPPPSTVGVLLAGGLARRMGGGDKGLRTVGGQPIIARVIAALRPQLESLVLNANGDPGRFASFGLPVVADTVPGHPGPLAGILAGLDWAARHSPAAEWVLSAPTDTPFLPPDLASRLHAARATAGMRFATASSSGRAHPVITLWPVAVREDMRAALAAGERRVEAFATAYGFAQADWPSEPRDPFFNANTEEDIARAEAILAR